ncbi:MAG: FAD-binding oxidoreductase, partial [Spirochaetes bacterium]|nr:FAD-binding oxidoreductase [Spirochaetota bacterium]
MKKILEFQVLKPVELDKITNISITSQNQQNYYKFLTDESRLNPGQIQAIYFPQNIEELAFIAQYCSQKKIVLTISGARTGIVGGAVPKEGILVSLEKMNQINEIGFDEQKGLYYFICQPGVTLEQFNLFLKNRTKKLQGQDKVIKDFTAEQQSFIFPVDPTETSASLGGMVASNASGARSYCYGSIRQWVRKIKVLLPDGKLLSIKRGEYLINEEKKLFLKNQQDLIEIVPPAYQVPDVKNAAGIYSAQELDLIDLFIGCEGLLGIIAEIELYVIPLPIELSLVLFFTDKNHALDFVRAIKSKKELPLTFLEFVDSHGLNLIRQQQDKDPLVIDVPLLDRQYESCLFFDLICDIDHLEDKIDL